MSSERVRDILLKQWPLIVVCILAGALGVAVAGRAITRSTPRYQATATIQTIIYGSVTECPALSRPRRSSPTAIASSRGSPPTIPN